MRVSAVLALLLVGCDQIAAPNAATPNTEALRAELDVLKSTVATQAATLANQSSEIGLLKLQVEWLQNKTTFIDVSSQSYQCIETNTGKFLIACDNVQPYADGQKLTFRIGNPNFVTFSGFKLKAKWGSKAPVYPQNAPQPDAVARWQIAYAEWQKALREKEIDSAFELKPGIWNTVEVVLSPATAEQLGYLELSMETNQVLLYRDKPR